MKEIPNLIDELNELTRDVKESVEYLRELGVFGIEENDKKVGSTKAPDPHSSAVLPVSSIAPALERHSRSETATKIPAVQSATKPAIVDSAVKPLTELKKAPSATLSSDSLFDVTPSIGAAQLPGETFEDIHAELSGCVRCPLHECRTRIVHTEGNRSARLMFVGEAPGADEDAAGRPFVGRAGQLLNKIIEAIGMRREEVLIGNVNRCRPTDNRTPTPEEARTCKPFLIREINIVRPRVIVVLGNTAMKNLLDTREGITRVRGKFQDYRGIKVMPTFHPAYLLRDPSKKREVWDDMKLVRDYLTQEK